MLEAFARYSNPHGGGCEFICLIAARRRSSNVFLGAEDPLSTRRVWEEAQAEKKRLNCNTCTFSVGFLLGAHGEGGAVGGERAASIF